MFSVPYSRYLFGTIPWYSFLIVTGAAIAIVLAVREEKRTSLKKDTVIDFALLVIPAGIIGARIYYVVFSWDQFKNDLVSVLRIWEGGIAIYGAVIAGLLTAWIFCRKRKISFFTLCDLIAPGLILAQAIGRWGNYFNQEAYGLPVNQPGFMFFPFAVQIQTGGELQWHMATFFYESAWNLGVFVFLMVARRKWFRYSGDVISFYGLMYACGRLIVEDFRMDSLYAGSSVRISQLLSVAICAFILFRYIRLFRRSSTVRSVMASLACAAAYLDDFAMILCMTGVLPFASLPVKTRFFILFSCSVLNIAALIIMYAKYAEGRVIYADVKE